MAIRNSLNCCGILDFERARVLPQDYLAVAIAWTSVVAV